MPHSPVAPNIHEALDVHGDFGPKGTFHLVFPLDLLSEEVDLLISEILGPAIRIHPTGVQDFSSSGPPDPKDVGQGHLDPFASGQINT
jgi:hypothetical protein